MKMITRGEKLTDKFKYITCTLQINTRYILYIDIIINMINI